MIACSRMYDATPAARAAWHRIFRWAAERAGVPLEPVEHAPPARLEALWARTDMGCVFMCGWPYAMAAPRPLLLAAPVPAPVRYGGQPVYVTDFVVRRDAPYRTLADSFGRTLAWTVDHSHSGYNAVRHHLLGYRTAAQPKLYARTLGPLLTPKRALRSVLEGEADVAPLDGFYHDLLRRHAPETVAGLRVVETTAAAPIPPMVAAAKAEAGTCARLTDALLAAHRAPELESALASLLVARFATVKPDDYDPLVSCAAAALAAGYPAPA